VPNVTSTTNDIQESSDDARKSDGQVITGTSSEDSFVPFEQEKRAKEQVDKYIYKLVFEMYSGSDWTTDIFPQVEKYNIQLGIPYRWIDLLNEFEKIIIRRKEQLEEKEIDILIQQEKELAEGFKKNKTEGTYALAQYITKRFNIITVGEKDPEMFVYQEGMYRAFAENEVIYPEIQRILQSQVTKSAKTETFHKISGMTFKPRSVFSSTPTNFIPLANGVYNFTTKELLPHSAEYKFKYQFPIQYDPEATCLKIEAFIDQILTPTQRTTVEEWIGYYFWRDYRFKKAMVFVGEGDTGKTTLLEVITYLLGRDNIASISLQKMTGDKFSAAHMYEKHGNLVDELSAKDISDTDAFKMATGNGSVTGEYKFGNQFSFRNFAKLTFACNRIPDMADNNDLAYFNRWIPIRFEKTIEKKIPNFADTLTAEEERSGLFNLAMKGLSRLLEQGHFSYSSNGDETKLEMMRSGSSIAMFASDMLERNDQSEVSKEDMYDAYIKYCQDKKLSTQTKDALGKKLSNYATYMSDGLIDGLNSKGKPDRVRGWRNVKIRGKEITEDDFDNI
jgi:putative DNA primase/helicase